MTYPEKCGVTITLKCGETQFDIALATFTGDVYFPLEDVLLVSISFQTRFTQAHTGRSCMEATNAEKKQNINENADPNKG